MVFTPDGKRLITGGADKTIQVWDVETRQRVKLFRPPIGPSTAGQILDLALAPDGKTLVVGASPILTNRKTGTNSSYLLNLEDGRIRVLDDLTDSRNASRVAFSADGKHLALGLETQRIVYPALGDPWGEPRGRLDPVSKFALQIGTTDLAFSPTGERILTTGRDGPKTKINNGAFVLDARSGKVTEATFPTGSTEAAAWLPDGKSFLTGHAVNQKPLRLWSVEGGPPTREFTQKQILGSDTSGEVDVSRILHKKGNRFLLLVRFATKSGVLEFDLDSGKGRILGSVPNDAPGKNRAIGAISSDGRWAALGAAPRGARVMRIDLETGETSELCGPEQIDSLVGWTTTGNSVTLTRGKGDRRTTMGLNLRTLERLDRVSEPILHATTKRDGHGVKQGANGLELVRGEDRVKIPGRVTSFTLPGGGPVNWIACSNSARVELFNAATGKSLRHFSDGTSISSLAGSPDGRYLVVRGSDVARVYNVESDRPLLNVYTEGADWVAWTEEGYHAASPNGERLIGWTVNQGLDREANLLPAEQFRATLYRPDVIALLLDKGSVAEALKAANAARKMGGIEIPRGVADPEKLLPPNVSLKIETREGNSVVTVHAEQGCVGQPIKSLRLLVDGRPFADPKARATYEPEREKASEVWTVELPPGKHRVAVLAGSKDDTPSVSSSVLVDTPLPAAMRPIVHHVAVGVSKYADDKLNLKFADKAALDLAGAIKTSCTDTIYQKVETTTLTNAGAKRDAVLDALDATRKVAKSTDLLILTFAGHGIREDGEFYLLTHEADTKNLAKTTISGAALRAKLADYPCQVLLMLDACHSGAFAPLARYRPATDEAARALADVEMRVAVMCAAQGHEEALEAKGNGHFTSAVISALGKKGYFDAETGELNVYHLQAFVYQEVSKATDFKQNPYLKMPLAHLPVIVTRFPKGP